MPAEPRFPGTHTPYWVGIAFLPIVSLLAFAAVLAAFIVVGDSPGTETFLQSVIVLLGFVFAVLLYLDIRYVRQASTWRPDTKFWTVGGFLSVFMIFVGTIPVSVWYLRKRRQALGTPQKAWVTEVRERIRDIETPGQ